MEPLRLNALVEIGPVAASKASMRSSDQKNKNKSFIRNTLFKRVRASLSQKWIVPSEPAKVNLKRAMTLGQKRQTTSRKCPMDRMKRNVVDSEYQRLVFRVGD